MRKRILSAVLCSSIILTALLTGCSKNTQNSSHQVKYSDKTINLMDGITAKEPDADNAVLSTYEKYSDFAINLLKNNLKDNHNVTVSPASAIFALAMTANGADGKTKDEMLALFNENSNIELNMSLYRYEKSVQSDDSGVKIANSIWINNNINFEADEDFLQTNADYYNSSVFLSPFDDSTAKDINKWVDYNTDGGIPELIKEVGSNTIMTLINTVLFDADWESPFDVNKSFDSDFNNSDGTKTCTKMMNSDNERYIYDDNTKGFSKEYSNGYEFVALLPDDGISIEEYLESLTAEKFSSLFEKNTAETAHVTIPAFKNSSELTLNKSLHTMGMKTAFDGEAADFSRIGKSQNGNIYIDSVMQNTEITVDELGTKASAATKVDMADGATLIENSVICDRPFIYFIIDSESRMPLFAGVFMSAL